MRSPSRRPSRSDLAARVTLALAVLAGLSVTAPASRAGAPVDYAVVVSPDVSVESITFEELQKLFRFQKRYWRPGQPVNVILPATGSDAHAYLLAKVLRTTDGSLHRAIVEKMYRGEMDRAPKTAASDDDAVSIASSGKGQITLVVAGERRPAGARILTVERRKPGEEGYPLRE